MVSSSVKISELWAVHVHPALAPPLSSHDPTTSVPRLLRSRSEITTIKGRDTEASDTQQFSQLLLDKDGPCEMEQGFKTTLGYTVTSRPA